MKHLVTIFALMATSLTASAATLKCIGHVTDVKSDKVVSIDKRVSVTGELTASGDIEYTSVYQSKDFKISVGLNGDIKTLKVQPKAGAQDVAMLSTNVSSVIEQAKDFSGAIVESASEKITIDCSVVTK